MPTIPKDKAICYTYIKETNAKFLKKTAKKTGQSVSFCLDKILDAHRQKKAEVDIPVHEPKYVKKARAYQSRKRA
jgi:hypothetical protein